MTNYIILALCIIVILSYIFDITSKFSKIPGVFLLILLGIGIRLLSEATGLKVPEMKHLLPVLGTVGLIMIVLEASLDLELKRDKSTLIIKSVSSAFFLLVMFVFAMSFILVTYAGLPVTESILNSIPPAIISSSVAISSAVNLDRSDREFVIYESSFSDIFGIMLFDFILLSNDQAGLNIFSFSLLTIATLIIALLATAGLAILLHKIKYHVNYVIIITSIILVYSAAKLIHLPALMVVLIFGLVLSNNRLFEKKFIVKYIDFSKFRDDIISFKKISGELTFIIRSFFFIMFGYYTKIDGLFDGGNLLTAAVITFSYIILRWVFFRYVIKIPATPLLFFSPRGLITILLFLSIPGAMRLPMINEEVITLIIFMTMLFLMTGNFFSRKNSGFNEMK